MIIDEGDIYRFCEKIEKDPITECWNWTGSIHISGYGLCKVNRKTTRAHRFAYRLAYGYPFGNVLHKCDNKRCVNPKHLFLGTQADNVSDMFKKGRQANLKGENNSRSRLKNEDIPLIRQMSEDGMTDDEISYYFNVTRGAIWGITSGKYWKHILK